MCDPLIGGGNPEGASPARRRRLPPWLTADHLAGGVVALTTLFLYRALLAPGRLLGGGDIPAFHLPLRATLRDLLLAGEPWWNPLINGGQPVLSNPNYAALYPVTWLLLPFPPATALHLTILLHAAWAALGAWKLARSLGCGGPAAAIAALGFVGGPLLGITVSVNIFCSLAWLPWVVRWGAGALEVGGPASPDAARAWWKPAALTALGLALQLLAGDPTPVILTGLLLGCLGLVRRVGDWRRTLPRLAAIGLAAAALSAVQLLPTLLRVAETPRIGHGESTAATWSMSPTRAVEFIQPSAFGRLTDRRGYYFGAGIHDKSSGYVGRLSFGLLPLLLGLAAALRWRVPGQAAWAAAAAAGFVLALGRHFGLAAWITSELPPFSLVRFPEKYVLLTASVMPVLAALGWQYLLDRRTARRPAGSAGTGIPQDAGGGEARAGLGWRRFLGAARGREDHPGDFPAALALVVAGLLAAAIVVLQFAPERIAWLVQPLGGVEPPPGWTEARLGYLTSENAVALALALGVTSICLLLRWKRLPALVLSLAAVGLLAGDLAWYGHDAIATEPRAALLEPPTVTARLTPGSRIYGMTGEADELTYLPRQQGEYFSRTRWYVQQLAPYTGNLYGLAYAVNTDYDALATRWGRWPLEVMDYLFGAERQEEGWRYFGAWNVTSVIWPLTPLETLQELEAGNPGQYAKAIHNPYALPRYRPVPEVLVHPDIDAALAATVADGLEFPRREHWVEPGGEERGSGGGGFPELPGAGKDGPGPEAQAGESSALATPESTNPALPRPLPEPSTALARYAPGPGSGFRLLGIDERSSSVRVRYTATAATPFVAALTWHPGWRARIDPDGPETARLTPHLTAAGQIGLLLPAGEHELLLRFREDSVYWGAAVTLLALIGAATLLWRGRGRPHENR